MASTKANTITKARFFPFTALPFSSQASAHYILAYVPTKGCECNHSIKHVREGSAL